MILEEISTIVNRDKSTAYRSLQKLASLGMCVKQTKTIKEGGHYHLYCAVDTRTFKLQAENKVRELEVGLHRILTKFEDSMDKDV